MIILSAFLAFPVKSQQLSREQAEGRLEVLKSEIRSLQESLAKARKQFANEQAELQEADLAIQASSLELRELGNQMQGLETELQKLEADRTAFLASLNDRKDILAQQIVSAYQLGRESRLKLLLNQDSPARLSRMLAYYDYFSRAQGERIRELREALSTLDRVQAKIDTRLLELNSVRTRQEQELLALQDRREQRQQVIAGLAGRIGTGEARLTELSRNRADLEALLDRLSDALADIPTELGQYVSALELRGSIPMPVRGRVLRAFGQPRLGGLAWQGWLIEAEPGREVSSIAYGRVAYADWLRGYGLLMIIDHGDGIMSLYGNNESLLFEVGDWVQPGSPISTVGVSSSGIQGLYFELRNNGKAADPAVWLTR